MQKKRHGRLWYDSEWYARNRLIDSGYKVYRNGWPDFLAVKHNRLRLVEVKLGRDKVTPEQSIAHKVLKQFGLDVEVWWFDRSGRVRRVTLNGQRTSLRKLSGYLYK